MTRDSHYRVTKTTDPNGNITQQVYNALGQVVNTQDGLGNNSSMGYDALGRGRYSIDAVKAIVKRDYDSNGQLRSLTDAVGNVSEFQYDNRGKILKEIDPFGNEVAYEYDNKGRMTKRTDRLGRVREFSYDDDDLLTSEVWKTSGTPVNTITYSRDDNHNLLTAGDNAGTYTMMYDALNRVTSQTDVHNITLTILYDAIDRITQVSDGFSGQRDMLYDAANRVTAVKFTDGTTPLRWDYTYNDRNEVTEIKRYSDLSATTLVGSSLYGYDDGGRVTSITHKDSSAVKIDDFVYTYNAANQVTAETSYLGPDPTYDYDPNNQLIDDGTNTYAWDNNGNPEGGSFSIGTANQLSSDGTYNLTYDDEGNITAKVNSSSTETWLYGYNHLNQLVQVQHKSTSGGSVDKEVDFEYDVFGNLVEKSYDADGAGAGAATVEKFAYEPLKADYSGAGDVGNAQWNAWADLDNSGSLITRRLYQDAIDAVMARIDDASGDAAWYLTDKLGSVRDMVDDAGALQDRIAYDSWGAITTETNSSFGDRYKWTGREWHVEIAMQYNRARWYDPELKRWISQDPIGFNAGDSNLYRYTNNRPTMATDPSGLDGVDLRMRRQELNRFKEVTGREPGTGDSGEMAIRKLNSKEPWRLPYSLPGIDTKYDYTYHRQDIEIILPKGTNNFQINIIMDEIYQGLKEFRHFNPGNNSTARPIAKPDSSRRFVEFTINDGLKAELMRYAGGGNGPKSAMYVEAFYDDSIRQVTAITLGDHVVSGSRKWRVYQEEGKIIISTWAFEKRATTALDIGFRLGGGKEDMKAVWETYLGNIGKSVTSKYGGEVNIPNVQWGLRRGTGTTEYNNPKASGPYSQIIHIYWEQPGHPWNTELRQLIDGVNGK